MSRNSQLFLRNSLEAMRKAAIGGTPPREDLISSIRRGIRKVMNKIVTPMPATVRNVG